MFFVAGILEGRVSPADRQHAGRFAIAARPDAADWLISRATICFPLMSGAGIFIKKKKCDRSGDSK